MNMEKYQIGFDKWSDVVESFSNGYVGASGPDKVNMEEPEGLIVARYDDTDYSADAQVLWRNPDGTFGFVEGSHCSCYGLEDQWSVETYTKETLLGQFDRALEASYKYGFFANQELRDLVAEL